MKTFILVYEGFVQFEVILASYFLKTKGEIITVGRTKDIVTSEEGFQIIPHITLAEMNLSEVDAFLIPGGMPSALYDWKELYTAIQEIHKKKAVIGAVCSGPVQLAKAGILSGRRYTTTMKLDESEFFESSGYLDENVVVDGNIITAKANGYVDFAIEVGKMLDIYEDEADLAETIRFFKYFQS